MILPLPYATDVFFIFIRLGTVLVLSPIQAIRKLPIHASILFVFVLSLLISNFLPKTTPNDINSDFVLSSLTEFANGLILSTSLYACFAVFHIAGTIIDNQIGFNSISIFNPAAQQNESLSSHLLSLLSVLIFFSINAHLWLFKGLTYSFTIIPPGSLSLFSGFNPVIQQCTFMFSMAVMISSPIIITMLVIDWCSGIITRSMPQVSTYFLSLPIKIVLGLIVISLELNYFQPLSNAVFTRFFQTWQELMS